MTTEISIEQQKETARNGILAGTELSPAYLLMNVLAATIASYGLLANSPAVIIGAMLIAMLLGPITGISLALVDSDMKFLFRGFATLLAGAAVVFATAYLIGYLHIDVPLTKEIMARTQPNLSDLVIALAGGAAGAYATVSPRLSVAFVGVAIATALVPPLCAANILFARGEFALGGGALLLTFTNIVAIQFSSSAVFWLSGFRKISHARGLSFLTFMSSNLVSIAILCVLAVVLTHKVHEILTRKMYETSTEAILRSKINNGAGSYMVAVFFNEKEKGKCTVTVGTVGTNPPSAEQVAAIEKDLPPHPEHKKVELRIRYAQTAIINREGLLFEDREFGLQE